MDNAGHWGKALWCLERHVCPLPFYLEDIVEHRSHSYFTHPDTPGVNYPEGFQGTSIPVYGPAVAKLIEDRLDGKL